MFRKVGVGIFEDCRKLASDYNLRCEGLIDLRHLARRECLQLRTESLQAMSAWAGLSLSKDPSVRLSDWAAPCLRSEQIRYACEDAIVGLAIVRIIYARSRYISKKLSGAPLCWRADLESVLVDFCIDFCDVPVSVRSIDKSIRASEALEFETRHRRVLKDASSVPTRKSDLYHNCRLEAPDGSVLANLDHNRAAWYLRKGLAVALHGPACPKAGSIISHDDIPNGKERRNEEYIEGTSEFDSDFTSLDSEMNGRCVFRAVCACDVEPGAIRLLFEPKGRGHEGNEYYTSPKANVCVACGKGSQLQRYSVVPPVYRRLMPEALKSRSSFDIVLLCTACHQRADCHAAALRETLARECSAPLKEPRPARRIVDEEGALKEAQGDLHRGGTLKEVRSLAKALLTAGEKLPPLRRAYAESTLAQYFQVVSRALSRAVAPNCILTWSDRFAASACGFLVCFPEAVAPGFDRHQKATQA